MRLTRRCAAETDPDRVLRTLLEGAVELVEAGNGAIARWDEAREELRVVATFLQSEPGQTPFLVAKESATGRAVVDRAPIIANNYQTNFGRSTPAGRDGAQAVLAVPLLQEGRILGAISLSRFEPDRPYTTDDAYAIELLAGIAASVLVAQEERRRAEQNVRASEQRFHQIAEAANDIIWLVDEELKVVYVNRRIERLGYTPAELIGTNPHDLYAPEARAAADERHRAAVAQARSEGESHVRVEVELVARDGTRVLFENATTSLLDGDGVPVRRIGVLRDISERKRAEEALRASEARFRQIAEAADDIIWVRDRQGRIAYVNGRVERLGYTPEELLGRPTIDLYAPEDREAAWERFRRAMADEEENVRREIELVARNGARIPFESSASTLRDAAGQPIGRVAVLRDVSDRRTLEAELRRARDLALEMSEAKSSFLANMSHEIRTPLNGVIGMSGLLLDTELAPEQREYAEVIRGSGEALLTVINDILDFSKLEAERVELEEEPFDLRECLESAIDLVAMPAAQRGLELACVVDPSAPETVVGDAGRIRQVLLNLLSNAVKFTERGEVVASVAAELGLAPGSTRLHFTVRDTGVGISPDRIEAVFDAFAQADVSTARRYGGTGLGLAIGRRLSELMGGRMWAESRVGEGSTFHFTVRVEAAAGPIRPRQPERLAQVAGCRVLVVDDNATNRQVLVRQAEAWGMRPRATARSEEALDWIAAGEQFELAMLDVHMPELDGLGLSERIRRYRPPEALPIVLLTSLGHRPTRATTEQLGVAAVLSKPVKAAQLFDTLTEVLGPGGLVVPSAAGVGGPRLGERLPLRILLVEDNAVNQKVTLGQLARLGYRADLAANGLEALDALERQRYDLVLMDVQMPEMDGLSATRRIAARWPANARPRIVAMTAHALPSDRDECLRAGMDDYLSKPIRLSELADALARAGRPAASRGAAPTDDERARTSTVLDDEQLARLRDEVGEEVLAAMLGTFWQETPAQLDELGRAIEAGDAPGVRRLAHTVRGSGRYLGAAELDERCGELEALAQAGTLDRAGDLLDAVRDAYRRLASGLAARGYEKG